MGQTKKVSGVATSVSTINGVTSVVYHNTTVVQFDSKTITLNTGGWQTVTTKARMNQASSQFNLGYGVSQVKGKWFVDFKGKTIEFTERTLVLER